MVCITGQVPSKLLGTDAFQETDITGVTLPITKHNYLVTRVEDIAPTLRQAFYVARSGRPGPVLVDITKDAQQAHRASCGTTRIAELPALPAGSRAERRELERAAALIDAAERPIASAGTAWSQSGASARLLELAEKADIPVASTLLGLGGFPATPPAQPRDDGDARRGVGQPRHPGGGPLVALGMRFDDRVTGNLKTYAAKAKKIHVELDPRRDQQERARRRGARGADVADSLRALVAGARRARARAVARTTSGARRATRRCATSRAMPPDGRLFAAHVIHDLWRITEGGARRHRRGPAPDVGGAVLQARVPALARHLGRPRHDGLRAAGGDRRQLRVSGRRGLGGRRRRRLPDDRGRAVHRARRRASSSTSPSSTTATWAWSASGRSSSTAAATRRRPCAARTS